MSDEKNNKFPRSGNQTIQLNDEEVAKLQRKSIDIEIPQPSIGVGDESTSPGAIDEFNEFMAKNHGIDVTNQDLYDLAVTIMKKNDQLTKTSKIERTVAASVLKFCPVAISIFDATGRMIAANKKALEISGKPPTSNAPSEEFTEFYGVHMRLDGSEYKNEEFPVSRAIESGLPTKSEFMIAVYPKTYPQGVLLNVSTAPIKNEKGEVIAAIVFQNVVAVGRYPHHNNKTMKTGAFNKITDE